MRKPIQITGATVALLVVLRLAIGWHFLFEGSEKLKADSWSSEGYLREASGPLGPMFRKMAGDTLADRLTPKPVPPGEDPSKVKYYEYMPPALEKEWQAWYDAFLKHYDLPRDTPEEIDTKLRALREESTGLADEWQKLDEEQEQIKQKIAALKQNQEKTAQQIKTLEADAVRFETEAKLEMDLTGEKDEQQKRELRARKEYAEMHGKSARATLAKLVESGKELEASLKAEEKKRADLAPRHEAIVKRLDELAAEDKRLVVRKLADVRYRQRRDQTVRWMLTSKKPVEQKSPIEPSIVVEKTVPERMADYRKLLEQAHALEAKELRNADDSLSKAKINGQIRMLKTDANRIRSELRDELNRQATEMRESVRDVLTEKQYDRPVMASAVRTPLFQRDFLGWIDTVIPIALVVIGACLLLGFLTRTMCIAGALLLVSFYLAMPPWPGTPENLKAEGHYLFVNKNIVEMLALLTLATTRSGRWVGLDGLLHSLCCNRKPKQAATPAPAVAAPPK